MYIILGINSMMYVVNIRISIRVLLVGGMTFFTSYGKFFTI